MGSFPHEFPGYRHVSLDDVRAIYERLWGRTLDPEPGLRIPNMFDAALAGTFRGVYIQGEDIAQSDPNTQHVEAALRAMDLVVVQDLFLNETARFAHVFLPGTSFLEKDGTFTNAERRINRVRPVFASKVGMDEWEITCAIGRAMGYDMSYAAASEIMDEIAATTQTFAGVSFARLDEVGSMQWPVLDTSSTGTPIMHIGEFVRGKGRLDRDGLRADDRAVDAQVPADPHHRPDPQPVQRRRADPAYAPTTPGTPRTSSRSTRPTRRCVASRPVTWSTCPAGSGRRRCGRWCRSGCLPASSTRPSTTR